MMKTLLLLLFPSFAMLANIHALSIHPEETTRRRWLAESSKTASAIIFLPGSIVGKFAGVAVADDNVNSYSNPNIPSGPEERSGLIVLRVAEVAQFQGWSYCCIMLKLCIWHSYQ